MGAEERGEKSDGGVLKERVKEQFSHSVDASFSSFQRTSRWRFKDTSTGHQADGHLGCLHASNPWTCYLLTTEGKKKNKVQISRMGQTLIYTAVLLSLQSLHPPPPPLVILLSTEPTAQKTPSSLMHIITAFIVRTIFASDLIWMMLWISKKILIITFSLLTSEGKMCLEAGKGHDYSSACVRRSVALS